MSRILLLLAVVIVIALLHRRWQSFKNQIRQGNRHIDAQKMVRCDYCGLHIPEQEILHVGGQNYCSQEHRALDQARQ
jgi:uncharacterized protein